MSGSFSEPYRILEEEHPGCVHRNAGALLWKILGLEGNGSNKQGSVKKKKGLGREKPGFKTNRDYYMVTTVANKLF